MRDDTIRGRRFARSALVAGAIGAVAAMGLIATAGRAQTAPSGGSASGSSGSMVVPVDRQDYVADHTVPNPQGGASTDPYNNDPSSIHVAINGGQEFARSFVHLALDYLPSGDQASGATMTLVPTGQSDASNTGVYPIYNVNTSQAIIQACVLTSELPSVFDPSNPPAYNCELGSSVGKANADGSWTFNLKDLVPYWNSHGNTGAALIPVGSGDPSQNWAVAFYKSRSGSGVSYVPSPAGGGASAGGGSTSGAGSGAGSFSPSGATASAGGSAGVSAASSAGGATVAAGSPTNGWPVAAAPSLAGSPQKPGQQGSPAPRGRTQMIESGGGGSPVWPWVLLGCLGVALAAVGIGHRQAILAALPRTGSVWRTHPRAYTVAVAAVSWGLVFGAYSAVNTSRGHVVTAVSGGAGANDATGGATGTGAGAGSGAGAGPSGSSGTGASSASLTGAGVGGGAGGGAVGPARPGGASGSAPVEFAGPGTWRTINGIPVFFPANGGPPEAQLYSGADNTIGITPDQVKICAHAALTYGSAFHINASDLDVYWQYVNAHGGIFGRQVKTNYQNDNYDPGTAVTAAQTCKDWGTFFLLGGIGFDQIPAVRQWAEQNHELYIHHIATIEGSQGLRYSFSPLPTVEQVGTWFGQVAAHQFPGEKVGILYRQSSNWTPGVQTFTQAIQAAGMQVVGSYGVQINQGSYEQELTELHTAGAQVIFAWENALAEVEMIQQAQDQNWFPAWLVNGFDLISNTLGATATEQQIWGPAEWDQYDSGYYGDGFASYAGQIHEFEAEYKQYDPNLDLNSSTGRDGADLLFANWEAQKWTAALLTACGADCTRNKLAGLMLAGFNRSVPPNCPVDFGRTADHHHGGFMFNVIHAIKDPNGNPVFVPVARCVTSY
ncbi:MAG TPA: ABC transporter substrate-binding protein [Acidimicrobiales bacterium]|nr:ABC transporter substrate-binding protein [Acidimicrobiales bacterium]